MIENKQNLRLSSDLSNIHYIEEFIEKVSDEFKINTTYYGNILIAITEAVENAIKHGNKSNPDKNVDILFEYDNSGLKFTIQDDGEGFDFENLPDPTEINENVGRGIYLIRALADYVKFDNNGSKLEISFEIANISQQTAINRINELHNFAKKKDTIKYKQKDNRKNT